MKGMSIGPCPQAAGGLTGNFVRMTLEVFPNLEPSPSIPDA